VPKLTSQLFPSSTSSARIVEGNRRTKINGMYFISISRLGLNTNSLGMFKGTSNREDKQKKDRNVYT
jgi:hypothetical protein